MEEYAVFLLLQNSYVALVFAGGGGLATPQSLAQVVQVILCHWSGSTSTALLFNGALVHQCNSGASPDSASYMVAPVVSPILTEYRRLGH